MNLPNNHEHERLLDEVLSAGLPENFRDALLGRSLQLARRRRRARQASRAASALVLIAAVAMFVWRTLPPPEVAPEVASVPIRVVRTAPLHATELVTTHPLAADHLVATVMTTSITTTSPTHGQFRVIDDRELIGYVGPRPVALVRRAAHSAELVFVNPTDRDLLLRN